MVQERRDGRKKGCRRDGRKVKLQQREIEINERTSDVIKTFSNHKKEAKNLQILFGMSECE